MKPYLLLLFIVIALAGCKTTIDDSRYRNENYVWWVDAKTGEGHWVPIDGEGMPVGDGVFTRFYFNGNVFSKYRIANGKPVDTTVYYDIKGQPMAREYANNGDTLMYFLHNSPAKTHSQTGVLWGEGTISGHTYGHWRKYYESGKVHVVYNLKNDTGWVKNYYENGTCEDSDYQEGKHNSINIKHWSVDGKLLMAVYLTDHNRNGYWEQHSPLGQLIGKGYIVNRVKEGEIRAWFESGKLKMIQHAKNGVADGRQLIYYENGRLKLDVQLTNGVLNGERKMYSEDGKLTSDEMFENGQVIGKIKL